MAACSLAQPSVFQLDINLDKVVYAKMVLKVH